MRYVWTKSTKYPRDRKKVTSTSPLLSSKHKLKFHNFIHTTPHCLCSPKIWWYGLTNLWWFFICCINQPFIGYIDLKIFSSFMQLAFVFPLNSMLMNTRFLIVLKFMVFMFSLLIVFSYVHFKIYIPTPLGWIIFPNIVFFYYIFFFILSFSCSVF